MKKLFLFLCVPLRILCSFCSKIFLIAENAKKKQQRTAVIFFFLFSFFFSLPLTAYCQLSKMDSLLSVLKIAKEDTNKVETMNELFWELKSSGDYIQAKKYADHALALSEKINFVNGKAASYNNIGVIYKYQGNYPEALKNYFSSLKILESLRNQHGIASAYSNIGNIYYYQGNYLDALKYHFAALKTRLEIGDKEGIAGSYNQIGNIYSAEKKYPEALKSYLACLKIMEDLSDQNGIASAYNNIGIIYGEQGDFPQAIKNHLASLKIKKTMGDKEGIATSYINLAEVNMKRKKFTEAKKQLEDALSISKEIGDKDAMKETYEKFAPLYSIQGNYKRAYENYKMYIIYRDSLLSEENTKKTVQSQMQYDFDKKQTADSIKNAEQVKQEELKHEQEIHQQKTYSYGGAIGFLLMIIVAGVSFNAFRQKHKANIIISSQKQEVEKKNQIIEEKNKDITDSINYAKRIQQALLPSMEIRETIFPNAFILFQPRDIVSGDFYWFAEKNGKRLIAAVDCTGHGVPGAFMSMIGNAFLNEIVNQRGITQPDLVLGELRHNIISSLKQKGESGEQQDGMDIALFSFDYKNNVVEFAGANNPLWLIRNGECIEYKSDKRPIGYFRGKGLPFTNHKIELQKDDVLYIFSDGYTDQFGGEKRKKFMKANFKTLLLSLQEKTMHEQKIILLETFNNWKGNMEQIDDVLVIGVRV